MRSLRTLATLALATVLALGSILAMTFVAPAEHPLRQLAPLFDRHPAALADRAMTQIGAAAARGRPVPPSAKALLSELARRAPLSDDPFLVEATVAQMAGEGARSERLLLAARSRNPRSQGARYFLAERYLKTGRILPGLVEMGVLARLSETASQSLVPALAAYARSPGAIAQLKRYFATAPSVRDSTLALLAGDARNQSIILALAPRQTPQGPAAEWQGRLTEALVLSGDYAGADALWSRLANVTDRGLLYNPTFRKLPAPQPFNWAYNAGSAGVAEPAATGGLDVIYYGREEATFAKQVVLLAPGSFRLAVRLSGAPSAAGLAWTIACVPGGAALLALPLGPRSDGETAGRFAVPAANCEAQVIELRGRPEDIGRSVQATILGLKLERSSVSP